MIPGHLLKHLVFELVLLLKTTRGHKEDWFTELAKRIVEILK